MHKTFGSQLRAARKKQKATTQVIADECGVARSYITLIENGKRLPSKKVLPKLATALHIKATVVLNWYLEDISHEIQQSIDMPATDKTPKEKR